MFALLNFDVSLFPEEAIHFHTRCPIPLALVLADMLEQMQYQQGPPQQVVVRQKK